MFFLFLLSIYFSNIKSSYNRETEPVNHACQPLLQLHDKCLKQYILNTKMEKVSFMNLLLKNTKKNII